MNAHGSLRPILAACAALLAAATTTPAQQVKFEGALSNPVLLAGARQTVYLRVALTGEPLPGEKRRNPVNIAIVLDRSGSMQGEKIAAAKRAAMLAVDRLRPDDIVSVIAYESTVDVLIPATRATDKNALRAAIGRVTAGGSTALFAGVSKAAGEVQKFAGEDTINRIILLSDGLANVGPSSPGELGDLGRSLGAEGIAVTTLGLGLGYNEDLMTRLAQLSDGNHMFVENATDLARAYEVEFGDAMSVVARDVELGIRCADGVRPVRVLGRDASIDGPVIRTSFNQLGSGQTKYVLAEVEMPDGPAGHNREVASMWYRYQDLATNSRVAYDRTISAHYTDSKPEVDRYANSDVMVAVVQQIGAERNALAMRLRDEGRIDEARKLFVSNGQYLRDNGFLYSNQQLLQDGVTNTVAGQNLDDANWNRQRKQIKEYQFNIQQQSKGLK